MADPIPLAEVDRLRNLGRALATIRAHDEGAVVLSIGAHAPDFDCPEGSVSVTIAKAGETATAAANATDLATALMLARGKVNRQIEAREKKRASDRDEHPKGEDAQRLSGEAMPARASEGGIAQ